MAEEEPSDDGVVGALKSLLDPNEKTKSGKLLPKDYLKSARQVVKTLRESLKEDTKDGAKFRRTADAAKESIKEYAILEKAIRSLAGFYSKAGPSATLPEEVKSEILGDLTAAEEFNLLASVLTSSSKAVEQEALGTFSTTTRIM